MKLSILVPTLIERKWMLSGLLVNIYNQISKLETPCVEVVVNNSRYITTGEKRNELIKAAKGSYIWFIDDDDFICEGAICDVLEAIKHNPDVVVFNGFMTTNGINKEGFELRIGHPYTAVKRNGKNYYLRFPNHIVPIKKDLIKDILFEHITIGEDYKWAKKINDLGILKTQEIIDKEIYHYQFRTKKTK